MVNPRVVAATNKDLKKEIEKGNFREDLYHRLSVILIHVPSLSERKEDIPLLAEAFLKEICEDYGMPLKLYTPEALKELQKMTWTGNIRELRNVMERAVILSRGETIDLSDLPDKILASPDKLDHSHTLEQMERRHIEVVLEQAMTLEEAAEMLGINVATLWRKRQRYELD